MSDDRYWQRPLNLLLVEDNEDDVLLTKHAFKKARVAIQFQIARDGLEALAMLRRQPPYSNVEMPSIILLDLNMPRMDGRQFLAEIKQDELLKTIPAIILTTSTAKDDIYTAYQNYANAYMTKPIDLQEFACQTQRFADFWLSNAALLPPSSSDTGCHALSADTTNDRRKGAAHRPS